MKFPIKILKTKVNKKVNKSKLNKENTLSRSGKNYNSSTLSIGLFLSIIWMKDKFNLFFILINNSGKKIEKKKILVNTCSLRHIKWIIWHHKIALFKCHSFNDYFFSEKMKFSCNYFLPVSETAIHAHSDQSSNEWAGWKSLDISKCSWSNTVLSCSK